MRKKLTRVFFPFIASLLETVQDRLRRIAEELNYFDSVLNRVNQLQVGLEDLLSEVTNLDSFSNQEDQVDEELSVCHGFLLLI